jgi:hypothetical protein
MKTFKCYVCKETKEVTTGITTGYGYDKHNHKVCFECCGENDKKELTNLKPGQKFFLYLTGNKLTNWPGTLEINNLHVRKGHHNIARTRYDVWFVFSGNTYHGVQYGENTQVCHITRVKN